MSHQETKVSDKHTVDFWNQNFSTSKSSVKIDEFAAAFVKRFQSGEDGYPVLPSNVLFRIIDHFIARKDDNGEVVEIKAQDIALFSFRFGSLPTAVQLVAENFLDRQGEVHMWYHFETEGRTIDRKLLAANRPSWLIRGSSSRPGDLVLVLKRQSANKEISAKKEILIEHIKDKATGKVHYGCRVSDNAHGTTATSASSPPLSSANPPSSPVADHQPHQQPELTMFSGSLLEFLHTRIAAHAEKFVPLLNPLYYLNNQAAIDREHDRKPDDPFSAQISDDIFKGFDVVQSTPDLKSDWTYAAHAAEKEERRRRFRSQFDRPWSPPTVDFNADAPSPGSSNSPVSPPKREEDPKVAFTQAARDSKKLGVIKQGIDNKMDINVTDKDGLSALHHAGSAPNNTAIVSTLIAAHADVNLRSSDMSDCITPVFSAVSGGAGVPVLELLLNAKADVLAVNKKMESVFHGVPIFRDTDLKLKSVVTYLCDHGALPCIEQRDREGRTPAQFARYKGKMSLAKYYDELEVKVRQMLMDDVKAAVDNATVTRIIVGYVM